jgi:hypothetical protein
MVNAQIEGAAVTEKSITGTRTIRRSKQARCRGGSRRATADMDAEQSPEVTKTVQVVDFGPNR